MADWRLLDYAKDAEDAASGLSVFINEIPQYSKEITGDIAELFAISSALRSLHEDLDLDRYGRYSARIFKDLDVCLPSLRYTLEDVVNMFSKSKRKQRQAPGAFPGTPPYAQIWEDVCEELRSQGISLPIRLSMYRAYLQGMSDQLKGDDKDQDVDRARIRLAKLVKKQEPMADYFKRLAIDPRAHAFQESCGRMHVHLGYRNQDAFGTLNMEWLADMNGVAHTASRTPRPFTPPAPRPHYDRYSTYPVGGVHHTSPPPLPPHSPAPRPQYDRYQSYPTYAHIPPHVSTPPPPSPRSPAYGIGDIPFVPPMVPSAPQSPTISTASSQTHSTHSNDSAGPVAHWAMRIFDGRYSSTPFQVLGQPTKCLGRDEPKAIELLDNDGFENVLELPFESNSVIVRLYWRAEDSRSRILFLTQNANGRKMRHCFPLTGLKFLRTGSCLQLCRVNRQDGQLDLWANLRFTLYERMVLLYCTMSAMKRQDNYPTAAGLEDFFQPGEKEEFGGEIQDDRYLHAFRIFRDRDSGCVRFEATPRRGPLKTTPIWTAFVTQYIGQRNWMKRVGPCTVQFRELHPYMFCEGYRLRKGPTGKYLLTFTTADDARQFMDVFHHIRTR
ncbi:hypothetical protein P280DRAFT_514124 [Massarina eburnea CBS 473.64]|uniref:Uncharacterized protein n=1 Tax=Massarina eburnea CBS 473.64 TaxID=1395130 RepID=A0A6A6SA79_9PLEO|nr:hypothetical protein P280DRAFT_514124 [Massarina eburnea CBS 473.64]